MSYCRFSSDDWRSDVYVYAHCDGHWQIHVAANRIDPPPVRVDEALLTGDSPDPETWAAQFSAQTASVTSSSRKNIDHPLAGSDHAAETPGAAADILDGLKSAGFRIPDGVIDTLRDEQRELDGDTA